MFSSVRVMLSGCPTSGDAEIGQVPASIPLLSVFHPAFHLMLLVAIHGYCFDYVIR